MDIEPLPGRLVTSMNELTEGTRVSFKARNRGREPFVVLDAVVFKSKTLRASPWRLVYNPPQEDGPDGSHPPDMPKGYSHSWTLYKSDILPTKRLKSMLGQSYIDEIRIRCPYD